MWVWKVNRSRSLAKRSFVKNLSMGDIEKFITDNRKAFDDELPPDGIWENITAVFEGEDLIKKREKSLRLRTMVSAAAMLVLIASAAILFYYTRPSARLDYSQIDPVLAKQQVEYASLINEKKDALSTMAMNDPQLYQEFTAVIEKMQANYKQLKTELNQSPNKELTLEAMINNLKVQIEVLNQQLEILNYIHKQEKKTPYEQI